MNDLPELSAMDTYESLRNEVLEIERRQNVLPVGNEKWQAWEVVRLVAVVKMNMFICMSGDLTINPGENVMITSPSGTEVTSESSYAEHLLFAIESPRLLPVNKSQPQGCLSVIMIILIMILLGVQR